MRAAVAGLAQAANERRGEREAYGAEAVGEWGQERHSFGVWQSEEGDSENRA